MQIWEIEKIAIPFFPTTISTYEKHRKNNLSLLTYHIFITGKIINNKNNDVTMADSDELHKFYLKKLNELFFNSKRKNKSDIFLDPYSF